jgi:hypothetical protein
MTLLMYILPNMFLHILNYLHLLIIIYFTAISMTQARHPMNHCKQVMSSSIMMQCLAQSLVGNEQLL